MNKNPQKTLIFLLFACIFALVLAYISQYIFGLMPCRFCLWQRIPFFASAFIAILFLAIYPLRKYQKLASQIIVLLLLINAALAFYHAGVEKKWFREFGSCASVDININNIEDLKLSLQETKAVRCDEPQFVLFDLSMAAWNVLYCLGLILITRKFIK
jgi:disulfide bond formation protein DsbB